ncbi:MAG TPA: V-type ATPase subunit [Spirochaetota bacterium]|mgnify:CR=1 FL=1|nr:V-type ATPase subunit [Spirochaetota bacterium]HPI87924.1 V-type ATPase subunit [Spirochaetota bacterium]HPR47344.1 V-type ATPase subunit [Spirochaetota bacterium]
MIRSGPDTRYTFVTGVIRALEAREIGDSLAALILSATSPADIFAILRGTYFHDYFAKYGDPEDFPPVARWGRLWILAMMDTFSSHDDLGALFRLDFDYNNIKLLIKARYAEGGMPDSLSSEGTVPLDDLIMAIDSGSREGLPALMRVAVNESEAAFHATGSARSIDLAVDHQCAIDCSERATALGSSFIEGYYRLRSDCININTLLRIASRVTEDHLEGAFIPGGSIAEETLKQHQSDDLRGIAALTRAAGYDRLAASADSYTDDVLSFEREITRADRDYLSGARYAITGVEPLFAFGKTVQSDISMIGTIVSGMRLGIHKELIVRKTPWFAGSKTV